MTTTCYCCDAEATTTRVADKTPGNWSPTQRALCAACAAEWDADDDTPPIPTTGEAYPGGPTRSPTPRGMVWSQSRSEWVYDDISTYAGMTHAEVLAERDAYNRACGE